MSQENVEVVRTYVALLVKNLRAHWDEPRSYATDFERDESDPGSREVFELLDNDVRWQSTIGEVRTGKLGFAKMADELLAISAHYSADTRRDHRSRRRSRAWRVDVRTHRRGQRSDRRRPGVFAFHASRWADS